jgi:hypothetical protein
MKTRITKYTMMIVFLSIFTSSCKDPENKPDSHFIIVDYEPDIVLQLGEYKLFDINGDGIDDFKAFNEPYSSFNYLKFEPVNENCLVSEAKKDRSYIYLGDEINDGLEWEDFFVTWFPSTGSSENGNVYLAIKILNDTLSNFGWLLPIVKGEDNLFEDPYLIIDKTAYCTVGNSIIVAGQED